MAALTIPSLRTVAVEASPTNAFLLKWNLFSNGITDEALHVVVHGAMGIERSSTSFADCGNSWFSGARGSARRDTKSWKDGYDCVTRTVPTVTMPDVMREHAVNKITLLRQDCEGCEETTVVDWKRSGLINSIGWWSGEYHLLAKDDADATEAERILCGMLKEKPCYPERRITAWGPGLLTCVGHMKKGNERLKHGLAPCAPGGESIKT